MSAALNAALIDVSALGLPGDEAVVEALGRAASETGFICVTGAGVDPALIAAMRAVTAAIFDAPEAEKAAQAITRENYRGHIPLGFFTPNDGGAADRYEGWKLHAEIAEDDPIRAECALYGPNVWPAFAPEARPVVLAYWAAVEGLAMRLLAALARWLDLAPAALTDPFDKGLSNMTLLGYPARAEGAAAGGIHAHKDSCALTIIAPDPVGGLLIRPRGASGWSAPACPPGGFIVNTGDMLEVLSGGRLPSTPHKVVNESGRARISFPWFAVPRWDYTVRPLAPPLPGFAWEEVRCGPWSAEIWRTNWPDAAPDGSAPLGGVAD